MAVSYNRLWKLLIDRKMSNGNFFFIAAVPVTDQACFNISEGTRYALLCSLILPLYVPARSGVCRARTAAYWVIDERYVK